MMNALQTSDHNLVPWPQEITILLIDDDEEDYLITRDIIEEITHLKLQLEWVDNYQEAIAAMKQGRCDVYLVDYRLGAESGLTLIKEAIEGGCTAPMILLTGQDDIEVDAKAMNLGAADYLVKSQLSAELLDRSIRYSIQQSRTMDQVRQMNLELENRVSERTADLARAVSKLQTSEQLYSSIANQFPHGFIMVLNSDLEFVLLDGQDLQRLDIDQESLQHHKACSLVVPEKQPVMEYYLKRVLEGESLTFEFDIQQYSYAFRGTPLTNSEGEIDKILVACINITQQKQVEQNIRKALSKEKQLNELKSRFIAMASHEFRTPLSAILSSVSLIGRYLTTEEQGKRDKHINRIKSNVSNLTGILDDFLSLSKLEEGRVESNPVLFDLPTFLNEVTDEMQGVAKTGQELLVSCQGAREVYLDKRLLKNILINLISNATKYSPADSEVEIYADTPDNYVRISVKDYGIGIPEEEQIHLFERFYRANNATNIQGTGLGLNIVQKYVSLMGGKVEFESQLDQGTTFTLFFPRTNTTELL